MTKLSVLAGGGIAGPLREIAALYGRASGHRLELRFGTTPELIAMATSGDPFDLGVIPRDVLQDAGAQARFAPGPTIDVARVGLGIAVRAGAAKPDIGTPEALKQALLAAKSIAAIPASAAGYQFARICDSLGIREAVTAKIKVQRAPAQIVEAVAKGEAEFGVFLINVLLAPGLDVVGPVPAALQQDVIFTAAVAANTDKAQAARAFISHLGSPAAAAVIKAKGMNPC